MCRLMKQQYGIWKIRKICILILHLMFKINLKLMNWWMIFQFRAQGPWKTFTKGVTWQSLNLLAMLKLKILYHGGEQWKKKYRWSIKMKIDSWLQGLRIARWLKSNGLLKQYSIQMIQFVNTRSDWLWKTMLTDMQWITTRPLFY